MINPLRRLLYEMFVRPIINVAYDVIDLTKSAFHRLTSAVIPKVG
jgi:hypothetical protein